MLSQCSEAHEAIASMQSSTLSKEIRDNMAKMADQRLFCTQFLLNEHCNRGASCSYNHSQKNRVCLLEELTCDAEAVKGTLLAQHCANTDNTHPLSHQKCLFTNSSTSGGSKRGTKCLLKRRAKMDCQDPSTSEGNSASLPRECHTGAESVHTQQSNTSLANLDKQLNINAPEFVPRTRFNSTSNSEKRLCPFAERDGFCKYPTGECTYLHGDMCDLCTKPALHPYNEELRKQHTQNCIKRHERDMEIAFAVARSKEKICGICFEVIMQKNTDEQRFGILPSCNHCFCLSCIRRWRQSKQFENKIIRSCPECRIPSDFVCPSPYWVDTKEDKHKVIGKYKAALAKKDCKYFRFGRGHCPFGNKCFYRHCLQNGKKIDVGPPPSTNSVGNADALIDFPGSVEIIQVNIFDEFSQIMFSLI